MPKKALDICLIFTVIGVTRLANFFVKRSGTRSPYLSVRLTEVPRVFLELD